MTKALLPVTDMVDQGLVDVFLKKLNLRIIRMTKVAIEFVRRNNVHEMDMEWNQ